MICFLNDQFDNGVLFNCGSYSLGKKKQLHVDKPDDDLVSGPYGAMDDDDFM